MRTGERLRAWRQKAGLSQEQAAKKVGTTQRSWGAWETDTTPEIDFAEAIEKLTRGEITMRDWSRCRRKKRREDAASAPSSSISLAPHAEHRNAS